VISITDGQIFLEADLFYAGVRPAINVGLSVSRVGSAAQTKAMKQVAGRLKLDLARFRELAAFAQFASDLDKSTQAQLARGQRLTEILKQPNFSPMTVDQQVLVIYAASNGFMDETPVDQVGRYESELLTFMPQRYPEVVSSIVNEKQITKDNEVALKGALEDFNRQFGAKVEAPAVPAGATAGV
jgi:F-type H+-transporting ATPase subunit alpha